LNGDGLYPGVTRQIVSGVNVAGVLYDKTWVGDVKWTDLVNGGLAFEIEPIEWEGHMAAYVRAFLGKIEIPFSPGMFLGEQPAAAFAKLGVSFPDGLEEDAVVPNYMPDGVLVVNAEYFKYTLGPIENVTELAALVDVPQNLIDQFEIRCAKGAKTDEGVCVAVERTHDAKRLAIGAIVGITIGAVALVVIVAVAIVVLVRRKPPPDGSFKHVS
jgi:hypothetical protein